MSEKLTKYKVFIAIEYIISDIEIDKKKNSKNSKYYLPEMNFENSI